MYISFIYYKTIVMHQINDTTKPKSKMLTIKLHVKSL